MNPQSLEDNNLADNSIATLVHLGAGRCSELNDYLALRTQKIILVEAEPQLAEELRKRTSQTSRVQVQCAAIAGSPGQRPFHRYNLPDAGSLYPPSGILKLYPGLRIVELLQMETVSPETIMAPLELKAYQKNYLIIDLPGEELQTLRVLESTGQLQLFCHLQLYCGRQSLYEGGAPANQILEWLQEIGFDLIAEEIIRDPDLPRWTLSRNPIKLQNQDLKKQLSKIQIQLQDAISKNEIVIGSSDGPASLEVFKRGSDVNMNLSESLNKYLEQATQVREEDADLISALKESEREMTVKCEEQNKHILALQADLGVLRKESDENAKLSESLKKQLEQASKERDIKTDLVSSLRRELENMVRERDESIKAADERQSRLDKVLADNTQHVKEVVQLIRDQHDRFDKMGQSFKNDLIRETSNSTKQLEAFIGIQTYLTRGQTIPEMHGWPVSPDFALYLINLIEDNDFDAIIEFGSGTSTVIMAKTILRKFHRQAIKQLQPQKGDGKELSEILNHNEELEKLVQMMPTIVERAIKDYSGLQPRIISFEHQRQFFEETQTKLHQGGVTRLVDLVHAPLHDYITWQGEHFLYYACEQKIVELANELKGDRARILVVVDGPPAVTGKHARYPALPIVLQYLSDHRINILLDDLIRQDEQEILERWIKILNDRALVYTKNMLKMEKKACLLAIE